MDAERAAEVARLSHWAEVALARQRLRSIVAACRNPTRLALANVQLLVLDG